jgi:hypothetical protein
MSEQISALICDRAEAKNLQYYYHFDRDPHALRGFVGGVLDF